MEEIWKDVVGWEGLYEVSNFARVRDIVSKRVIVSNGNPAWYSMVTLYKNGSHKTRSIHRLMAMAFIENPESKPQVNHINGIKSDNRLENLEWCTVKENIHHAINTGLRLDLHLKGSKYKPKKLTKENVLSIKSEYKNTKTTYMGLGRKYGVTGNNIRSVIKGHTWNDI